MEITSKEIIRLNELIYKVGKTHKELQEMYKIDKEVERVVKGIIKQQDGGAEQTIERMVYTKGGIVVKVSNMAMRVMVPWVAVIRPNTTLQEMHPAERARVEMENNRIERDIIRALGLE